MQKISSARIFVICAILKSKKKPLTGYEIGMHYALTHQAVYREFKNLYSRGFLHKTKEPQEGKPDRILYTANKRKALKDVLIEELAKSRKASAIRLQDIDAALAAIDIVGKEAIMNWLHTIVEENKKTLDKNGTDLQLAYRKKAVEFASEVLEMVANEFEKEPCPD